MSAIYSDIKCIFQNIRENLIFSVEKRLKNLEAGKIACILNDDYESNLLCSIVSIYNKKRGISSLRTFYTANNYSGVSLSYLVSHYLETNHVEFLTSNSELAKCVENMRAIFGEQDADTISDVIPYYFAAKHIYDNKLDIKYLFCSVGADELVGKGFELRDVLECDLHCKLAIESLTVKKMAGI
jgi:asparagine synthetase B (glutamine-hydrolysing)